MVGPLCDFLVLHVFCHQGVVVFARVAKAVAYNAFTADAMRQMQTEWEQCGVIKNKRTSVLAITRSKHSRAVSVLRLFACNLPMPPGSSG